MAGASTSTELLASLKRRGLIPTSANSFSASDFFKIVDDEIQTYIVPLLLSVREEYLVTFEDFDIDSERHADTYEYDIPYRAIGSRLRDVAISTSLIPDGESALGSTASFTPLSRVELDNSFDYNSVSGATNSFCIRGNRVVLLGTPTSGTLRLSYFGRPNRVVATTAVARVLTVDSGTDTVTFASAMPDTFLTTTSANLCQYDVIQDYPGFDTLAKDLSATVNSTTSMTFLAPGLPDGTTAGSYICLSQETPIAQIPTEMHPLLAERVTATVLHALGDEKANLAYKVAADMEKRVLKTITPRTQGSSRYAVNKYGVGRSRYTWRY